MVAGRNGGVRRRGCAGRGEVAKEGAEARVRTRGQRTGKDKKGKDEEGLQEGKEKKKRKIKRNGRRRMKKEDQGKLKKRATEEQYNLILVILQ